MGALGLVVALLPSMGLMLLFYRADRYEPEPRGHVLLAIALGAAAMGPTVGLVRLVEADFVAYGGLGAKLYEAFVLEGLVEEGVKWVVLAGVVYRWREFDEPMDGVIYGVAVALGFGTVENIIYVVRGGVEVGLLRALFAVPEHALLGATMGGFLGSAKHAVAGRRRWSWLALALLVPVALHGTYDLLLLELVGPMMYLAVAAGSAALWIYVLRSLRTARELSPFKPG